MQFANKLKDWCYTESGPYRRPFLPNPRWESASVVVVGTNPATSMRDEFDSFDHYWKGITESPDIFYERYRRAYSGGTSKSTSNAKILLKLLDSLNVLVTNVVWYPASSKKQIPKVEWELGFNSLTALIEHIRPKAVFCHGAVAEEFAKSLDPNIDRYRPAAEQTVVGSGDVLVLAYHHFSGQGLKKGAEFQPQRDFPIFARAIQSHVRA